MIRTAISFAVLACAFVAAFSVTGCSHTAQSAPPPPAAASPSPQQQTVADQMAAGRAADAQKTASALAARQGNTP